MATRDVRTVKEGVEPGALPPDFFAPVHRPLDAPPLLFVIVDTEEEFDWSGPFSREAVDVSAIDEVDLLQTVLARYRITPTYVIDYPVASTPSSAQRLGALAREGACHIGAHLHPWVNPPYTETLGARSSYACNLGMDLELDKILRLKEAISEHVGVTPRVYKAGRYGFGPTSAQALEWLDFDIDVSVNPRMNFTSDGGPNFELLSPAPGLFGRRRPLLEVPCTTGFVGAARRIGLALHRAASARWLEPLRAVGMLARSGALNRVMLSPEGNTLQEMQALTETLHRDGIRTFSLTFHSPSLKPGGTHYVPTRADRDRFLSTIDKYCEFFCGRLGGVPSTPAALCDELQQALRSLPLTS